MADAEQFELMQRVYAAVGEDFTGKDDLIGAKYFFSALQVECVIVCQQRMRMKMRSKFPRQQTRNTTKSQTNTTN